MEEKRLRDTEDHLLLGPARPTTSFTVGYYESRKRVGGKWKHRMHVVGEVTSVGPRKVGWGEVGWGEVGWGGKETFVEGNLVEKVRGLGLGIPLL